MKTSPLFLLSLVSICTSPCQSVCAQSVILNDDFSSPNYSATFFNNSDSGANNDDDSSAGITGTTGGVMEIIHFHETTNPASAGDTLVQSFIINGDVNYDPAASGNIAEISFSLDVNIPSGGAAFNTLYFTVSTPAVGGTAGGFTAMPAIEQDGTFRTYMANGLTDAHFSNLNDVGVRNFGFGFISSVDLVETGPDEYDPEQFEVTVDNFIVTITPVPEPSTLSVFLLGMMGVCLRRKRA